MDTEDSRATASSWAATASLALLVLVLGRFVTGLTAFTALTDAAFAAEEVEDFFPTEGTATAADPFFAEEADPTSATFLVGSSEPVASFPPVVFAIAIAFRLLPGKQTAENL